MRREIAEEIARDALLWIARDDEQMQAFLGATGLDPAALRAGARDPEMLAAVLDFVLMDDTRVMGFCDAESLPYTYPSEARSALPGGGQVHWT